MRVSIYSRVSTLGQDPDTKSGKPCDAAFRVSRRAEVEQLRFHPSLANRNPHPRFASRAPLPDADGPASLGVAEVDSVTFSFAGHQSPSQLAPAQRTRYELTERKIIPRLLYRCSFGLAARKNFLRCVEG